MTKTFKRLLCAFMAIAMLFCFVACDDKEDKGNTPAPATADKPAEESTVNSKEKDALAAVEDYIDEQLKSAESDETVEEFATMITTTLAGSADAELVELFTPLAKKILKGIVDSAEIDMDVVDEKDGVYEISVKMTTVDPENALEGITEESILSEVEAKGLKMKENGEFDGLSEEDLDALAVNLTLEVIEEKVEEALKSSDTTTDTFTVFAEEKDGEWVVTEEE